MITQLKAHYLMSKTTLSMGSLDVDSLLTDIPFDIYVNQLFGNNTVTI